MSQIIEGAVSLYAQYFWAFFLIAAVTLPLAIAAAAIQEAGDVITINEVQSRTGTDIEVDVDWTPLVLLIALGIAQFFVQFVAALALVAGLRLFANGQQPDFGGAYDLTLARLGTLIVAALRVAIVVVPLWITFIGIPVAIYFLVRWIFFGQAVLLDDTSAKAALAYSADAVQGSWWRTLGILIVIFLISLVPSLLVGGLLNFAPPLVAGLANTVVSALLLPFTMIAATMLYLDQQSRKQPPPQEVPA